MSAAPRRPGFDPRRLSGAILGGDAWVVPHEPSAGVWVTATAPEIRILDRRPASSARQSGVPSLAG